MNNSLAIARLAKIVPLACLAFMLVLIAVNNVTDYGSNLAFVQHVLSMDTLPFDLPSNGARSNATSAAGMQQETPLPSPLLAAGEEREKNLRVPAAHLFVTAIQRAQAFSLSLPKKGEGWGLVDCMATA